MKLAFLVSGNGDNFVLKTIHKLSKWDITVIGFDSNSTGLLYANEKNINHIVVNEGKNQSELTLNIIQAINKVKPDIVILLFHRLLGKAYFDKVKIPTINIHPSLLPSFKGFKAVDRAISHGVKITGVTIHLVDESEDGGPIIMQAIQPIHQKVKCYNDLLPYLNELYFSCTVQTILWIEQGRMINENGKIQIIHANFEKSNFYPNLESEALVLKEKILAL